MDCKRNHQALLLMHLLRNGVPSILFLCYIPYIPHISRSTLYTNWTSQRSWRKNAKTTNPVLPAWSTKGVPCTIRIQKYPRTGMNKMIRWILPLLSTSNIAPAIQWPLLKTSHCRSPVLLNQCKQCGKLNSNWDVNVNISIRMLSKLISFLEKMVHLW